MHALQEVDRIEILTLQDNYIDMVAGDGNEIVQRAMVFKDGAAKISLLAEHGFSALVTLFQGDRAHKILFDFGFSEFGADMNAEALGVDLSDVEALALSHGHMDHTGALVAMARKVKTENLELVVHPSVFRAPRFFKAGDFRLILPSLTWRAVEEAGVKLVEAKDPYPLADGTLLFLGEIPRTTPFEKGMPNAFFEQEGQEIWDPLEDDTALVANLKGRGLVVLSGCAHSGIVNTVKYAREATGLEDVHVIMGGFHLTGPLFQDVIPPTVEAIKAFGADYVVPTHCTGRKAVQAIEAAMPDQFLVNMVGTKMVFSA